MKTGNSWGFEKLARLIASGAPYRIQDTEGWRL